MESEQPDWEALRQSLVRLVELERRRRTRKAIGHEPDWDDVCKKVKESIDEHRSNKNGFWNSDRE